MKKNLFVIIGIFLVIIVILTYTYYNYRKINILAQQKNKEYEVYTQDAILGSTLMTLINKVSDQNEKNGVEKDKQNRYINNEENSIKIEVKFLESDKIFAMESISNMGSEAFIKNYNNMNFKCIQKEYHEKTKYIKYMLFEQIKLDVNER